MGRNSRADKKYSCDSTANTFHTNVTNTCTHHIILHKSQLYARRKRCDDVVIHNHDDGLYKMYMDGKLQGLAAYVY